MICPGFGSTDSRIMQPFHHFSFPRIKECDCIAAFPKWVRTEKLRFLAVTNSEINHNDATIKRLYFQQHWLPHKWVLKLCYDIFQAIIISAKKFPGSKLHVTYLIYIACGNKKNPSLIPWFFPGEKHRNFTMVKLQVAICWTLDFQSRKSWIHIPECTENPYT